MTTPDKVDIHSMTPEQLKRYNAEQGVSMFVAILPRLRTSLADLESRQVKNKDGDGTLERLIVRAREDVRLSENMLAMYARILSIPDTIIASMVGKPKEAIEQMVQDAVAYTTPGVGTKP